MSTTIPDILRYVLTHIHCFGYVKGQIWITEMPKVPTPREALAASAEQLERQRAYVGALENVEEAVGNVDKLKLASLKLLMDYLDHPDKGGGSSWSVYMPLDTSYQYPPSADRLETDTRTRIDAIREWETMQKAIQALINPSTPTQ